MNVSLVIARDVGFAGIVRRVVGASVEQLAAPKFRLGNLASNVMGSCALGHIAGWLTAVGLRHSTCA